METNGMSGPATATQAPVAGEYSNSESAIEEASVSQEFETEEIIEQDAVVSIGPNAAGEESEVEEASQFADKILEVAKEQGEDDAFEKLAEEDESHDEDMQGLKSEREESGAKAPDTMPEKVIELASRVDELYKNTEDLDKRVEKAEELTAEALKSAKELSEILKNMLEEQEEKKKEKNKSLLVILIGIMAKLMQIMVADPEGKNDQGETVEKQAA